MNSHPVQFVFIGQHWPVILIASALVPGGQDGGGGQVPETFYKCVYSNNMLGNYAIPEIVCIPIVCLCQQVSACL